MFGGIFNAGLAGSSSVNGGDFVRLLQEGRQQIVGTPGMQGVLDALAHAVHNIYLLSGLFAVLVFAGVIVPATLRLIKER